MKSACYLLLPIILVICLPAVASSGEKRRLTLDEAYSLAISTHESVLIAEEGVAQARSNKDKAVSSLLPTLTAEGSYTRFTEKKTAGGFLIQPESTTGFEVRVVQPLFEGGRNWTARRRSIITLDSSQAGLVDVKERIMISTARAYYNVLKAEKDLDIKDAALKRARERGKVAEARFKVGEVTRAAVLRAEAETAGAEADLIISKSALKDAVDLLRRFVGLTGDIDAVDPPEPSAGAATLEEYIGLAEENRKDYRRALLDEKAASEGITFAKGHFLPSLFAEGSYTWRDQEPQTTFFQQETTSGSLVLSYPIFEGGLRKAELSEARSVFREAELERLALKRDIEIEIRQAFNDLETARAVIESYRRQLAFAEEDYKMVFEQFKWGLATTVDVIDSDSTLIDAQRSYSNSVYDYALALLELKGAAGILLDESAGRD